MRFTNIILFISFSLGLAASAGTQGVGQQQPRCTQASPYADRIMRDVANIAQTLARLPYYELCRTLDVPNAAATVFPVRTPRGPQPKFMVYYNPQWAATADVSVANDFALIGVFAHEVGHIEHFANLYNPRNPGAVQQAQRNLHMPHQKELRADWFAGAVLARMGASVDDVVSVQRIIFSLHTTRNYPPSTVRLEHMLRAYSQHRRTPMSNREIQRRVGAAADLRSKYIRW